LFACPCNNAVAGGGKNKAETTGYDAEPRQGCLTHKMNDNRTGGFGLVTIKRNLSILGYYLLCQPKQKQVQGNMVLVSLGSGIAKK